MKCQLCQVFVRILEDVKEKENKIMARKDYDQFADELIAAVGGKENIVSVTNCMTRLRFVLADESIVKDDEVKKIKGVMSVVHGAGQYQIPIGTYVSDLCPVVKAKLGLTEDAMAAGKAKAESMRVVKKDSFFNKFFKAISGCILPMIAPMAAGGIIKGVLTILTTFGVLTSDNGIYLILYAAADALMYFMPIIVGFSAGKVFGMNPYTAAVIGAAMLYPKLAAFVGAEETLTFFGLKVTMLDYSQTMLPILLAVFVASWIEKGCEKDHPADAAIDVRADCGAGHHAAAHPAGGRPGHGRRFQCSGYRCQRAVQCGACGLRRCSGRVLAAVRHDGCPFSHAPHHPQQPYHPGLLPGQRHLGPDRLGTGWCGSGLRTQGEGW